MKFFVLSRDSKGKVTNLQISGFFSKKYLCSQPPLLWIFPGIVQVVLATDQNHYRLGSYPAEWKCYVVSSS